MGFQPPHTRWSFSPLKHGGFSAHSNKVFFSAHSRMVGFLPTHTWWVFCLLAHRGSSAHSRTVGFPQFSSLIHDELSPSPLLHPPHPITHSGFSPHTHCVFSLSRMLGFFTERCLTTLKETESRRNRTAVLLLTGLTPYRQAKQGDVPVRTTSAQG